MFFGGVNFCGSLRLFCDDCLSSSLWPILTLGMISDSLQLISSKALYQHNAQSSSRTSNYSPASVNLSRSTRGSSHYILGPWFRRLRRRLSTPRRGRLLGVCWKSGGHRGVLCRFWLRLRGGVLWSWSCFVPCCWSCFRLRESDRVKKASRPVLYGFGLSASFYYSFRPRPYGIVFRYRPRFWTVCQGDVCTIHSRRKLWS